MTIRWLVASLHLLALAIGMGAIFARARLLRQVRNADDLPPVFLADNLWALAAVLWLTTGLWRAFGGLEKGSAYYLSQPLFWAKMSVFVLIVLLELRPAITLVRWRRSRSGASLDLAAGPALATISRVQVVLVFLMVFLATAIARGLTPF